MAAANAINIMPSSFFRLESKNKTKNKNKPFLLHPIPTNTPRPPSINMTTATISATGSSSFTPKTVVDPSTQPRDDNLLQTQWSEFAKNMSGEWDGYGADFSPEGKPFELPESVVPEAYREWEVKVFDWQTQCPTLAEPNDFVAKYKLIKLIPTVGCEADAATRHSVDERNIGGVENNVIAFAYQSSGCYVAIWPPKDHGTYSLQELEHCLVDPQNRESRVRIIQVVVVEKCIFFIKNIKVFVEQWYGTFRNGEQLGGCSIRDTAFASTEPLKSSELSGVWQGLNVVANFQNSHTNKIQQLLEESVQKSVRDGSNLVLLPRKLWCSLKKSQDGETCCEVGWLLGQGHAITSKCIFSSNALLKEIVTSHETATLAK